MGSKVILTCVISQGPHDLGTIAWHRGEFNKSFKCFLFVENGGVVDHMCLFPFND